MTVGAIADSMANVEVEQSTNYERVSMEHWTKEEHTCQSTHHDYLKSKPRKAAPSHSQTGSMIHIVSVEPTACFVAPLNIAVLSLQYLQMPMDGWTHEEIMVTGEPVEIYTVEALVMG
jgi:hypothetical protein